MVLDDHPSAAWNMRQMLVLTQFGSMMLPEVQVEVRTVTAGAH
jgi:hypothetical protein